MATERRPWTDAELDILFDRFPPDAQKPSRRDCEQLARQLQRTPDAIEWQWQDANTAIRGMPSTASDALRNYLKLRGRIAP